MGGHYAKRKREAAVDWNSVVTELKNERDRFGRAIAALLGEAEKGIASIKAKPKRQAASSGVNGYCKNMSSEQATGFDPVDYYLRAVMLGEGE
jgi:hypothetical protein